MKCNKCNVKMEMFGVTERGEYKYCCNRCHKKITIQKKIKENKS